MLEESQFTLMGFIKGPVCRGQVALDVINDHFWVLFEKPDAGARRAAGAIPRDASSLNLRLPAEDESAAGPLKWRRYAAHEEAYLKAKSNSHAAPVRRWRMLWDGDGRNPNAALTVHAPLRQRLGGAGPARRRAADGAGHRLPAPRAHPLPARGRLRRLRQRRPPARPRACTWTSCAWRAR